MSETSARFWERGYCVIEDLLDRSKIDLAVASLSYNKKQTGLLERKAGCVSHAHDEYSPPVGEMILRNCQPAFEEALGRELLPGHAYWRIYEKGAILKRHVDRVGLEISATITLACEPDDVDWPIIIKDLQSNTHEVALKPGSALLYQGNKVQHWRETFAGNSQMQLMFFYVLKDGEFARRRFDGRDVDPTKAIYADG